MEEQKTSVETSASENDAQASAAEDAKVQDARSVPDEPTERESDGANADDTGANAPGAESQDLKTEKAVQTKEQNARFAAMRREKEQKERIKSAETLAIIDTLGGINPYTGEPMKDAQDVAEWRQMRELSKNGVSNDDIKSEVLRAKKEEARAREQEQEERESFREKCKQDREQFREDHPEVDIPKLLDNASFRKYIGHGTEETLLGKVPLTKLYEDYKSILDSSREEAQKEAAQAAANAKASPGALSTPGTSDDAIYSYEQVKNMSHEERMKNIDKIIESQKKNWGK